MSCEVHRANVAADTSTTNEYTNAIERFVSEYELYKQDVASGTIDIGNLSATQGRVYNVIETDDPADIRELELDVGDYVSEDAIVLYRDTKYPANTLTARKIIEHYTKSTSEQFYPKQSDMHYWYSPDCGIVIYDTPDATFESLNGKIISGQDASGNALSATTVWYDLTLDYTSGSPDFNVGDANHVPTDGETYIHGEYRYTYVEEYGGWSVALNYNVPKTKEVYGTMLQSIHGKPIYALSGTFSDCINMKKAPRLPDTVCTMVAAFKNCTSLVAVTNIPRDAEYADYIFTNCTSLVKAPDFTGTKLSNIDFGFSGCTQLKYAPDFSRIGHHVDMRYAMMDCTALEVGAKLPPSCIVEGTYNGCANLKSIELYCKELDAGTAYENCPANITYIHRDYCAH